MQLKNRDDVEWRDLPKVESPAVARAWVESNISLSDCSLYQVQGLGGTLREGMIPGGYEWDEHSRHRLLERIDCAEVVLIHGFESRPTAPVMRRAEGEAAQPWIITGSVTLDARHNLERMIAQAVQSRGIWEPILVTAEAAPAPEPPPEEAPEELSVTNPRWEHVDENRSESSPDATVVGDTVRLIVDVGGAADGTRVTFKVFDTSKQPPSRVGAARGEVEGGIGAGKWEVKVNGPGTKLEFEGAVRRLASERAEIPVVQVFTFDFSF